MSGLTKPQLAFRFEAAVEPPETLERPPLWFGFAENKLLTLARESALQIPKVAHISELGVKAIRQQFLGYLDGQPCFSAELQNGVALPEGLAFHNLRQLFDQLGEPLFALAGKALQIIEWDRTHQFCGGCGLPTKQVPQERARRCPKCELTNYPRLAPAVIVLIERGPEMLLLRSPHFREGVYSVLSGFVEPGESLEEAVHREVMEESNIKVKNISYFASQPWPFPNSLMIGFTAEYAGGGLKIHPDEIEDAGWFGVDNLPGLPTSASIARHLVDYFIQKHKK